jgi:hypothetical protein
MGGGRVGEYVVHVVVPLISAAKRNRKRDSGDDDDTVGGFGQKIGRSVELYLRQSGMADVKRTHRERVLRVGRRGKIEGLWQAGRQKSGERQSKQW